MLRRFAAALACIALLAGAIAPRAFAQVAYPDHPVRLVVPFPAGGGADIIARLIVPRLAQALGGSVIVDNRPGAGGNVGAEIVAHSPADGYTLLYGTNGTHAINSTLYGSLRFDPVKDFAPVSRMTSIAAMLVVAPSFQPTTVRELVAYARANPGKVNFASAGNGTTSHLAGEMFKSLAGLDIVHVPYRGGGLAAADLMAGQVQMMIDVMPNVYPLAKSGKLRGIAVSTGKRFPTAPELPTIAESGLAGFEMSAWDGIFAPAGTPRAVVDRLNAALRSALDDPEVRESLVSRGAQPVPGPPEDLAQLVASEGAKWAKVIRASGAHID